MNDVVWQNKTRDLTLYCRKTAPPALVNLLARTVWGARDVRYCISGIPEILAGIGDPYFLTLETNDALVGGVVAARKAVKTADRACDAFFIAMLATDASILGLGYGPLLARKAKDYGLALLHEPGIIYVYVESTHRGSLKIHRSLGYRDLGRVQTRLFSRIYPRDDRDVRRHEDGDTAQLAQLLTEQYAGHALLDFHQSLQRGNYYVLGCDAQIVAGAQAWTMHWSLRRLEGMGGFIALKVLPAIPVVRKEYSPEDFRFLRIGNIYVRPGYETQLTRLLESLLAKHAVHVGIIFLDGRSIVHNRIEAAVRFGVLSGLAGGHANVFAEFKGLEKDEIERLVSCPINISPADPM